MDPAALALSGVLLRLFGRFFRDGFAGFGFPHREDDLVCAFHLGPGILGPVGFLLLENEGLEFRSGHRLGEKVALNNVAAHIL